MIWRRVDLPQPDGPTKTKNSPCSTSILMPPSATTCSLVRSMCQTLPTSLRRRMDAITVVSNLPYPSFPKRAYSRVEFFRVAHLRSFLPHFDLCTFLL